MTILLGFSFLKPYLLFIAAVLVALSLSRAGLLVWQYERVAEAQGFIYILTQGLRFDLILLGLVLFLPLSLSPLMMVFKSIKNYWVNFVNAYLLVVFVIVVFVEEVGVGDTLHARDVELPAGVKLASSPELLLVTCALVAAAKSTEELEEEAPAAPEVIGVKEEGREEGVEEQSKEE